MEDNSSGEGMGDDGSDKVNKGVSSSGAIDMDNPLKFDDELQVKLDELRPKDSCENKGDFILGDMGACLPFKSDTVDGVISVSAIQWLC